MNKKLSIILPVHNEKESLAIMVRLLTSSLKFDTEILIVHDTLEDNSLEEANILKNEFSNVKVIHNTTGKGVRNAIDVGVKNSKYDLILVTAVDEIFPIIAIARIEGDINDIFSWDFVPNNDNYNMRIGLSYSSSDKDEMFRSIDFIPCSNVNSTLFK